MPVADPTSGRLFIWLISCFLFISIATGGTFLILYIILPQNSTSAWLPYAGVALVCLPWIFWCFTCLYRITSRALGFRFFIGGGRGGGGGGTGCGNNGRAHQDVASHEPRNLESSMKPNHEEEDGRHVQFGRAVVVGGTDDYDDNDGNETKDGKVRILSSSISSNDLSIISHESEMPLTSAMAS